VLCLYSVLEKIDVFLLFTFVSNKESMVTVVLSGGWVIIGISAILNMLKLDDIIWSLFLNWPHHLRQTRGLEWPAAKCNCSQVL